MLQFLIIFLQMEISVNYCYMYSTRVLSWDIRAAETVTYAFINKKKIADSFQSATSMSLLNCEVSSIWTFFQQYISSDQSLLKAYSRPRLFQAVIFSTVRYRCHQLLWARDVAIRNKRFYNRLLTRLYSTMIQAYRLASKDDVLSCRYGLWN